MDRNPYQAFGQFEADVALLAEGVDRNNNAMGTAETKMVALLAEGVDRNLYGFEAVVIFQVALLAEGVDRNLA